MLTRIHAWARGLKRESHALYLAARDRRTPWYARVLAACVVAYALSPIDLIPDFVPLLGYLDDALLLPLGIALALRLIPSEVMAAARAQAAAADQRPASRAGAAAVVGVWLLLATLGVIWAVRALR